LVGRICRSHSKPPALPFFLFRPDALVRHGIFSFSFLLGCEAGCPILWRVTGSIRFFFFVPLLSCSEHPQTSPFFPPAANRKFRLNASFVSRSSLSIVFYSIFRRHVAPFDRPRFFPLKVALFPASPVPPAWVFPPRCCRTLGETRRISKRGFCDFIR